MPDCEFAVMRDSAGAHRPRRREQQRLACGVARMIAGQQHGGTGEHCFANRQGVSLGEPVEDGEQCVSVDNGGGRQGALLHNEQALNEEGQS